MFLLKKGFDDLRNFGIITKGGRYVGKRN